MFGKVNIEKIESKMTLYGFKSLYDNRVCTNKMELDEYLKLKRENGNPDSYFGTKYVIDYIGEYADRNDVVRVKKNRSKSELINILSDDMYEVFSKNKWKVYDGDVTYIYEEFAKRGIRFENYSFEADKTKVIRR